MLAFERLAEEKIRDAIAAGEFDNLPGKGKPLDLDEPLGARQEDRLAHLVLKNGGFLPEYLQWRKELETTLQELEQFQQRCRERLGKHVDSWQQLNFLHKQSQAVVPQPPVLTQMLLALRKREQNAHLQRGKRVPGRAMAQRLSRLNQTYQVERQWLRERLSELAIQIEDLAKRLHEAMVEKEIRERREFLLLRQSPSGSRAEILARFDREFPATLREFLPGKSGEILPALINRIQKD